MTDQERLITAAIREARRSLAGLVGRLPDPVWREHKGVFETAVAAMVYETARLQLIERCARRWAEANTPRGDALGDRAAPRARHRSGRHVVSRPVRLSGSPGGTGTFAVRSRTDPDARYLLTVTPERVRCSCRGYVQHGRCWHVAAVAVAIAAERAPAERRLTVSGLEAPPAAPRARVARSRSREEIAQEFGCG